ncbi:usherin [Heterodontus francisci]|uniref:usherin n=1 Tax=Heterodontus francisci TaxID=7792 RepID=UPI00355B3987
MSTVNYLNLLYREDSPLPRMTYFLRRKGVALVFQVIEVLLFIYCILSRFVSSQGYFPRLENIGAYKSVSTVPSQATCGLPVRNIFCLSTTGVESILSCTQQFCIQECPYRSFTPSYADLFSRGLGTCVTEDKHDLKPGSSRNTTSCIFWNQTDCYTTPPLQNLGFGSSFTLAVWLKPDLKDVMTVIEKGINKQTVFKLTISETGSMFYYRTSVGVQLPIMVNTCGKIRSNKWTHLAIQTQNTRISFFINGLEEDNTAFDAQLLTEQIADATTNAVIRIGQSLNGSEQFIGRMQDLRFYQTALTNREILEVFSGKLPYINTQSNCRCPGTHPRVHPLVQRYCIPNGADDTTTDRMLRLNLEGHPLDYINDEDIGTSWVSSVFTDFGQLENGISITVDLQNGQYEVFYIILQFSSPQPEVVQIQRKKTRDSEWLDWQYFARDCTSVFGMANNSPLEHPDSVNCLQFPRTIPYSGGNVTFSILTSEPNRRPGYNDFYNTPTLQEFVKTTHVRIHLRGQYHTTQTSVNFRHRYYGVDEIIISGRCNCHGHADHCDTTANPYKCMCVQESHTVGNNCERCQPLFNDKPFHQGDQVHAYNCKPCQCYEHATSCHYDPSIDPFPHDYFQGGGGICDCQRNTTGRNCEWCNDFFYREVGVSLSAADVCKPCDCLQSGVINGSLLCDQIGGQCKCKRRVSGRQCNQCQDGFYNLRFSDPDGCSPCNCNTSGTVNGDITCHQNSGQCKCKANVIGITCEHCSFGFKLLNSSNSDGCESCNCNINGSENQYCNPYSGQCNCKANIRGFQCDICMDNFYGLDAGGCKPCECESAGFVLETMCDSKTGQCVCKSNVGGQRCDICLDGYYGLHLSNSLGCLPCNCDTAGTMNRSTNCDRSTGQCLCKTNVTGLHCDQCVPHTFNLSSSNHEGCQWCNCDPAGTVEGTVCDQSNGQCVCQLNRRGKQCDQCRPGFMLPSVNFTGCLPCECHPIGSKHQTCDGVTGKCGCRDPSVTGIHCDHCKEYYFGFNPRSGSCQPCNCNSAGSVNGTCHQTNGACLCKQFVSGLKCDICTHNMSDLDANNTFACGKTPIQQPPPTAHILNSNAVNLSWSPPDAPNSDALTYTLYRDGVEIHTVKDKYPFGLKSFRDTGLTPYTIYSYYIVASNVHGSTRSSMVRYRTKSSHRSGLLHLSHVGFVGSRSVQLNWTAPSNASGPIERYILKSTTPGNPVAQVHYKGLQTFVILNNLTPFTNYTFTVQACTTGGCIDSNPIVEITEQAPPEEQGLPIIRPVSSTELFVEWTVPADPNGIIIRYELYMRGPLQPDGLHYPPKRCIFQDSGWFNPHSILESLNESALISPQTHTTVTDLVPFTVYEFQVHTVNMAGSAPSQWASGRTAEAAPLFMAAPSVFSLSSSALNVTWVQPSNNSIRGEVIGYSINIEDEQNSDQFALPIISRVLHTVTAKERSYTVTDLKPDKVYNFTITVCNRIGCVISERGSGQTSAAAPAGLSAPRVEAVNSTMMKLYWQPPMDMNSPPSVYQLERMDTSLFSRLVRAERGTRFPGHGYFKFPSSTLPVNTYFTGIKLSFRTSQPDGLILFAVSVGNQEEYVVLQIRNGHPFFLFDPQGSAVAVTPTNDRGQTYNDNQWHHITATRTQAEGTIVVDGQYTGSAFAPRGSTIIGNNTGVFIGGLPQEFTIIREDTEVVAKGFVGCLSDVQIKKRVIPTEDWEPLDWNSAEEKVGTYHSWEGCPSVLEGGAHFLGQGYLELHSSVFSGGMQFEISFQLKTDKLNGLLFFAYNKEMKTYLAAELHSGILSFIFNTSSSATRVDLWLGLSYCDGKWKNIILKKQATVASVNVNGKIKQELAIEEEKLQINSPIYLGGIPTEAESFCRECELKQGFGGCIKDVRFTKGAVVNLVAASINAVRVNLDGCLSPDSAGNCKGNNSIVVYTGKKHTIYDAGLHPFTEYLYRIIASNQGGLVFSPWERGRTKEAVPQNVPTPSRFHSINGYRVEVSWDEPAEVRGVIEKYILKAYNEDSPSMPLIRANFTDTCSLAGNLTGLIPFTNYSITLTVCTMAGCGESADTWKLMTPEEAPEDVQDPSAISFPNSLLVSWPSPKQPNGIITHYALFKDGKLIYTGNEQTYNVTGLAVYSPHRFVLEACTVIGCTNSSQITLFTAQLPPSYVDAPTLTVLDSRSIYVQWREPSKINGHLKRYLLYVLTIEDNLSNSDVMYNSSDLFMDFTLRLLVPGTRYFIKLSACTGGGCTMSQASTVKTEESTPENVPAPIVHSYTSNSFNISWTEPELPNGIVIKYGLHMNGMLVENSSSLLGCYINDLTPWSLHNFRVQACTAKGCALGPLVNARTLESAPEGNVSLIVIVEDLSSVQVKWTAPSTPNGLLTYSVIFTGLFYVQRDKNNYSIRHLTQRLYESAEADIWATVRGLLPYSNYTVQVNASNSQGYVISDLAAIKMPPGAPDGVLPPRLSSATPTSLQVAWSAPARNNAPGLPSYQLQKRLLHSAGDISDLLPNPTTAYSYLATGLHPYTAYEFRLVISNGHGSTISAWAQMITSEDKPGPMDPPLSLEVKSQSLLLIWQHPSQRNGNITHYCIYQNGSRLTTLPGNITSYSVVHLRPYTMYVFQVESCTLAGCSLSPTSHMVQTLPKAPENISNPELYSDTPTSVLISWSPPAHPNGVINNVVIERKVKGTEEIFTFVVEKSGQSLRYVDNSVPLNPWTTYEYRILVSTFNGGTNSSAWKEVTTRPSRPAGVQPPHIQVLSPNSVKVTYHAPLMINGEILHYEIRMPDPRITISNTSVLQYTVMNLIPFSNYSVTIVACTSGGGFTGGCTESLPTRVITDPTIPQDIRPLAVTPISESFITVSWQPPTRPNGLNVRYELLRHKSEQPLASNPPEDLNLWLNIYSGTEMYYEDKGLNRYTTYKYKLIVYNDVGYTAGEEVTAVTLAGVPNRGSNLTAQSINHTAIEVEWTRPTLQDLEGDLEYYILYINSTAYSNYVSFPADVNYTLIDNLHSNTEYWLFIEVFNGAHSARSEMVHVTTSDGEPEGMLPPEVNVINSTAVHVVWTSPSKPNGLVTEYSIYVNKRQQKTGMNLPGSFVLTDLLPFTGYEIQVEVCTVYACSKSNSTQVTTVEDKPDDIAAPLLHVINSRSLRIDWTSPGRPNGIIKGYEIWRKTLHQCIDAMGSKANQKSQRCVYVQCKINENICGHSCYQPESQVCCDGVLYSNKPDYACCEDRYIASSLNSSVVCCSGLLHTFQPGFHCCGNYYVRVLPGEVCCPSVQQNQVSIGVGDSCCWGNPYFEAGNQICCGNSLHDGFNQQCCGKQLVSTDLLCCGNEDVGTAYEPMTARESVSQLVSNLPQSSTVRISNDIEKMEAYGIEPQKGRPRVWSWMAKPVVRHILSSLRPLDKGVEMRTVREGTARIQQRVLVFLGIRAPKRRGPIQFTSPLLEGPPYTDTGLRGADFTQQFKINVHMMKLICLILGRWILHDSLNSWISRILFMLYSPGEKAAVPSQFWSYNSSLSKMKSSDPDLLVWAGRQEDWQYGKGRSQEGRPMSSHCHGILPAVGNVVVRSPACWPIEPLKWPIKGHFPPPWTFCLHQEGPLLCGESSRPLMPSVSPLADLTSNPFSKIRAVMVSELMAAITNHLSTIDLTEPTCCMVYSDSSESSADIFPVAIRTCLLCFLLAKHWCATWLGFLQLEVLPSGAAGQSEWWPLQGLNPTVRRKMKDSPGTNISFYGLAGDNRSGPGKDCTNPQVTGINCYLEGLSEIWSSQHWFINQNGFQPLIRFLALLDHTILVLAVLRAHCRVLDYGGQALESQEPTLYPFCHCPFYFMGFTLADKHVMWHYINCLLIPDIDKHYALSMVAYQLDIKGLELFEVADDIIGPPTTVTPPVPFLLSISRLDQTVASPVEVWPSAERPSAPPSTNILTCSVSPLLILPKILYSKGNANYNTHLWEEMFFVESLKLGQSPSACAKSLPVDFSNRNNSASFHTSAIAARARRNQPATNLKISSICRLVCCGQDLVNASITLCCSGPDGSRKSHIIDGAQVKCCGTEVISSNEQCCNGIGYNPSEQVCADRTSAGDCKRQTKDCGTGTVCSVSQTARAYCNRCDFNFSAYFCTWSEKLEAPTALNKELNEKLCFWPEEIINKGSSSRYTFTDTNLHPYVTYEYRVAAWNSYGRAFSNISRATTEQDIPQGVNPPEWRKVDNRNDTIILNWKAPAQPNGIIIHYIVLRNGTERFRGTDFSFIDTGDIQPYQEYSYQLRACTLAQCADSSKVIAATVQGVPENVYSPTVVTLNATSLQLMWRPPAKPNGIIQEYQIHQIGTRVSYSDTTNRMKFIVTDLQPYTNYTFTVTACTSVGCSTSQPAIGRTLQASPEGVWPKPHHVVVCSNIVELYWTEPKKPNGIITEYHLLRDDAVIFIGGSINQNYTDTGLQPNTRYVYQLQANTGGECGRSENYIVKTPVSTPERIPAPYNITVTSPFSLFIAWTPPGVFNTRAPFLYNVALNLGTAQAIIHPAGHNQFLLVKELKPFTDYEIRIQACQPDGCGVGEHAYKKTMEAPPQEQKPPVITAVGLAVMEVKWLPPEKPNGIVTNYFIYRRPAGTQEELLVFIWSEGALEFIDVSDMLQPYTGYEYRVRALNSRGSVDSLWAFAQTLEAAPQGMAAPSTQATSAFSVLLHWTLPSFPNGVISQYRVVYQEKRNDPTINTTTVTAITMPGTSSQAHVFGLKPFTIYNFHVLAINKAGQVSSPWTSARTLEASPGGLSNFTVEKRENGRELFLKWSEPTNPNGIIKTYNIYSDGNLEYSGLFRQFLFRRLEPYTVYTLVLEACTKAGCTHLPPQEIRTDEAPPTSQPPPAIQSVNATQIELRWIKPLNANGKIIQYDVFRKNSGQTASYRDKRKLLLDEEVVFREYETGKDEYVFIDSTLIPWTRYEYKVRSWNSVGHADSPWAVVKTSQGAPTGLLAPEIQHVPDNPHKLVISWSPPEKINGVLQSYRLQRNELTFPFSFDALTFNYTDEGLLAYTVYSYAVIACTMGGCSTSKFTKIQTLETAPAFVSPPILQTISATQINASWIASVTQTGKICEYRLLVNNEQTYSGQGLTTVVSGLKPYTQHSFILIVCTNGGCTSSSSVNSWTMEAPPSNMVKPKLQVTGSESIEVTWKEPNYPNGQIINYELRRDGMLIYVGLETRYHDFTLTPGVEYSYTVAANNSQGSTISHPSKARTNPSAPSGMAPPKLHAWTSSAIIVNWQPPAQTNGVIVNYTIFCRDLTTTDVRAFTFSPPDTSYISQSFNLTGLKTYSRTEVQDKVAQYKEAEQNLHLLSSTEEIILCIMGPAVSEPMACSIAGNIEDNDTQELPPAQPQQAQEKEREQQCSTDEETLSLDLTLPAISSDTGNAHTLEATTELGLALGESPGTKMAAAAVPRFEDDVYSRSRDSAMGLQVTEHANSQRTDLWAHGAGCPTRYEVRTEACTVLGCASSEWASARTLEAPPTMQPMPVIELQTDPKGIQLVFLIAWTIPKQPNGEILYYELYRRHITYPSMDTELVLVYNGSSTLFQDTALLPYTEYEYQVSSVNSAGKTSSAWSRSRTGQAPPEGMYPPSFLSVHSTSAVVNITPPTQPNGIISLYRLFAHSKTRSDDLLLSEGTLTQQTIYGLEPFTNYSIGVEACTCFKCCSKGPVATFVTHPSAPANQPPPLAQNVKSMSANLQWNSPQTPNGNIQSYELQMLTACPQPIQPIAQPCTAEPIKVLYTGKGQSFNLTDLQPYTSYNLKVISYNSVGSTASEWITITTQKEMPQYKAPFSVTSNLTTIYVDWSQTFQLNGQLRQYVLTENNVRIYSGLDSTLHIPRTSDKTFLFQVICTTDMGSVTTPIIKHSTATGVGAILPTVEEKAGVPQSNTPFHNELWFIILMAILGLLFMAIFLAILLQRAVNKQPYKRERPPLIPLQKRTNLPNESFMGLTDTKIAGRGSHTSNCSMSVLHVPSQSQLSYACSQTSLHRSVSQLIDSHDRKSLIEDSIWESLAHGRDSGMYPDDEELLESIKSFSSVTKEHTIFTDTQL